MFRTPKLSLLRRSLQTLTTYPLPKRISRAPYLCPSPPSPTPATTLRCPPSAPTPTPPTSRRFTQQTKASSLTSTLPTILPTPSSLLSLLRFPFESDSFPKLGYWIPLGLVLGSLWLVIDIDWGVWSARKMRCKEIREVVDGLEGKVDWLVESARRMEEDLERLRRV